MVRSPGLSGTSRGEERSSRVGRNWTEREQAFRGGNDIKMGEDCIWRVALFVNVPGS